MTPKLTDEMRLALEQHPEEPIPVVDTQTNVTYFLVRADLYDREHTPQTDFNPTSPRFAGLRRTRGLEKALRAAKSGV